MKTKIDRPFFEKFNSESIFFDSIKEYHQSIFDEIAGILSSRLKISNKTIQLGENPFCYGVRDFQSVNNSNQSLQEFMNQCKEMILKNEPRVSNVEISKIKTNSVSQSIEMSIKIWIEEEQLESAVFFTF